MLLIFFFKQKTEYEMRISDWSSDVCSSDLRLSWGRGAWSREKMSSMLSAATPASSRAMVSRWPAALASGSRLSSSSARSRPSIAAPPASKERLPKVIRPDSSAGRRGQARRRQSGGQGKGGDIRVDLGGAPTIKKKQ